MNKDFILDTTGDLSIANGDFVIGDSEMQEVGAILEMTQGELKEDPIIGANLIFHEKSNSSPDRIKNSVALALKRDGKNYSDIKEKIKLNVNNR
jgi:hypothetical protein